MLSSQTLTGVTAPSSSLKHCRLYTARSLVSHRVFRVKATLKVTGISPGLRSVSTKPLESRNDDDNLTQSRNEDLVPRNRNEKEEEEEGEEKPGISRIQVSRQKYIQVSKAKLLDAIVLELFDSQDEDARQQFRLLSSCLDSILHAEHKSTLEQMRTDYYCSHPTDKIRNETDFSESKVVANGDVSKLTANSMESDSWFNYGLDLRNFLNSSPKIGRRYSDDKSRVVVATRFQRAFMQLLNNAQFEELSVRDLMLTNSLNTDYLLTLPIYVDWKRASESNAIIFRRGYATEIQKGLLIVEKLDYLQSRLLRGIFSIISKPFGKVCKWISSKINETLKDASQKDGQDWIRRLNIWLEELSLFQQSYFNNEQNSENLPGVDQLSNHELPIWLAAQRAVSRYEGLLSAVGPRGRLLRRFLARVGLIPLTPETPFQLESDISVSEPYLRPTLLSRISISDIWKPATRKYCGNDAWKMLKTSVSILLSRSILQEPAFQELILLYTKDFAEGGPEDNSEDQALQLKIYERIPIPDLPVIFPHKKLSFRIIDTVRLDVASILGLLAFVINYKFENILSSPSAIFLDVVAIAALIIYVSRVALGYKQTWDRYQLLVNKTLYEKTLASGFGAVHFLLDASEQQKYKEAILTYAILLNMENGQATCRQKVGDKCERLMYDIFKQRVEMPVDKALDTLVRLGLVTETTVDGRLMLQAIPCPDAYRALKDRWDGLLG